MVINLLFPVCKQIISTDCVKILKHRPRHLLAVTSITEGVKAEGIALFSQDPSHFSGIPILLVTEITQALLEIAEVAIRSNSLLKEKYFLGGLIKLKDRQPIHTPESTILLTVTAEKIYEELLEAGRIKAVLFYNKMPAVETIIYFRLLDSIPT